LKHIPEISAEALVRNIPSFSRFLTVAALYHGHIINFSNIASDAQVSRTTVQNYFQILQDTLIIKELPAWSKTVKRKATTTAKFYFFDNGVARILQKRKSLALGTAEFGEAFEGYLFHELISWIDYNGGGDLSFWRSVSGYEVDFILDNSVAIEVKAKKSIANRDLKGLLALKEETTFNKYIVVSLEDVERHVDGIQILPWEIFLNRLWQGDYRM
jgi:predicted AAA+ superfamily ATPase